VLDGDGAVKMKLTGTGLPLGILAGTEYEVNGPLQLESGDTLVMVTDGVTESKGGTGKLFEANGCLRVVRDNLHESAQHIARELCLAARQYSQRSHPADDTTAVVLKVD
jgi:sigma-B regulation protein RsbU (phosphoserine phosphatase)